MMYGGKESEIPNLPRDACWLVRTRVVTDIATGVNPHPPCSCPPPSIHHAGAVSGATSLANMPAGMR